ncbi:hypothetical protein Tco_0523688 [Tanacetum coccineum]
MANGLRSIMKKILPSMVDKRVNEIAKKTMPLYVAEGLLLDRQKTQTNMANMIVDSFLRDYMSNYILHVHPTQVVSSSAQYLQYQLHLKIKDDEQVCNADLSIWWSLNIKFEKPTTPAAPCRIADVPLGWHLEEIHVTLAQLEKKRTRLQLYTNYLEEKHTVHGDGRHQLQATTSEIEIDRAAGGKLRDKNVDKSWEIIENLAFYDHDGWNDSKDSIKLVKAISTPQSTSKTHDQRIIKLEDQINFLLKGSRPTPRPSSTHVPQAYAKAVSSNPLSRGLNEPQGKVLSLSVNVSAQTLNLKR